MKSGVSRHTRIVLYFAAGVVAGFLIISSLTTVELQRTACFGICPVYTLRVWGIGLVTYHGEFGLVKGDRISCISTVEAWRLIGAALSHGLIRFDTTYTNGNPDEEGNRTCLSFGPFTKCVLVAFRPTASAQPATLIILNQLIDQVTNSVQWTGTIEQIRDQYIRPKP